MFNEISDFTLGLWSRGRKTRKAPSGWITGNGPCCIHNGETPDKRRRGGFKLDGSGDIVYHCFNCGFVTGFQPGRSLPFKFRKLLSWLGASEGDVQKLQIDALRMKDVIGIIPMEEKHEFKGSFKPHALPKGAATFGAWASYYKLSEKPIPMELVGAVMYAASRDLDMAEHDFYWTPDPGITHMDRRLIIPFNWAGKIIGYTARSYSIQDDVFGKYHNDYDKGGYVYNIENLIEESDFVLVNEGPIDALQLNGVAVLTSTVSPQQAEIIDGLGKQVIVVPDQDKTGGGLIDAALHYKWDVAFPDWDDDVKDIGQAVERYGKLFTIKSVISSVATSKLKVELQRGFHKYE